MKTKAHAAFFIVFIFLLAGCSQQQKKEIQISESQYEGIEFEMTQIQEPIIPDYSVSITDFEAQSGGQILNTAAFAAAIEHVSEKGGGKIIIPAGIWLTGPIILKSNIELHAQTGALIKFSTDKDLYPLIETSFEGLNTWRCISPIYGKDLSNLAFTGNGIWDGSGEAWRHVYKSKLTEYQWNKLVESGGVTDNKKEIWFPSEQYKKGFTNADQNIRLDLKTKEEFESIHDFLRPVMVSIQNSKQVMFDGPVFQNSPAWCLHPLMVENLIVRNLTIRNPWYAQNADGIDVESCKNVIVENSNFDVGDDAICIKSGKNEDGRERNVPCENIIIRNNIIYHGHGGVTVGSEMSGGVKNMQVSNCTFMGTEVGLRFKSTRGRGGVVENIFISDIRMTDILTNAISFNLYYSRQSILEMMQEGGIQMTSQPEPITEETPQFKNISIKNVVINGAYQAAFLQGLPEMNLENIEISNLLADAQNGFSLIDANGVHINNVDIATKNDMVFGIVNCKNLKIENVEFNSTSSNAVMIQGEESTNIEFISSPNMSFTNKVSIGTDVPKSAVKF